MDERLILLMFFCILITFLVLIWIAFGRRRMKSTLKEILKHPLFLLVDALIVLWILESNLPSAIFGWTGAALLMVTHLVFTIVYLLLCQLQPDWRMKKEE